MVIAHHSLASVKKQPVHDDDSRVCLTSCRRARILVMKHGTCIVDRCCRHPQVSQSEKLYSLLRSFEQLRGRKSKRPATYLLSGDDAFLELRNDGSTS